MASAINHEIIDHDQSEYGHEYNKDSNKLLQ